MNDSLIVLSRLSVLALGQKEQLDLCGQGFYTLDCQASLLYEQGFYTFDFLKKDSTENLTVVVPKIYKT